MNIFKLVIGLLLAIEAIVEAIPWCVALEPHDGWACEGDMLRQLLRDMSIEHDPDVDDYALVALLPWR